MTDPVAELARRRNNLPGPVDRSQPLPRRLLGSPSTWVLLILALLYAAALLAQFQLLTADQPVAGGVTPGINPSAVRRAIWLATPTVLVWTGIFLLADRYRPQRWLVWFFTLGWGAAIATFISLHVNTWAAQQMAVSGNGDPASSARAAIFIAPFVEEAAKASVLFGIAIIARYRLVSKLSMIVLAGLSAAGFAFTENVIYYARAIVYSAENIGVGDADAAVNQLVWLRGFWTSFGHPLFTMMTGIGVAVALRTRSKVVRVLAPLVGYGVAVLLHMVFNSQASLNDEQNQRLIYALVALPMLLSAVIYVLRQLRQQGRVLAARLDDYAQLGWLPASDPIVNARLRLRLWAGLVALTRGWRVLVATVRLQRVLTELAYLRDGQVRGIYDAAADARARELLESARALRGLAIDDPRGLKLNLPRLRRAPVGQARQGGAPLGSASYSAVDPRWGPPPG